MNCDRCKEPMMQIDYYGERLVGCIECNCWQGGRSAFIIDLSVEDIQALRDGRQTRSIRRSYLGSRRSCHARSGKSFQEFADEAFADLLEKHKQPVGLMASLKESVTKRGNKKPR